MTTETLNDNWPNLYADNNRASEVSLMSLEAIQDKLGEYSVFLARTDIMPRARAQAERYMTHLNFEIAYLAGVYDA